jgi:hypothetical protein
VIRKREVHHNLISKTWLAAFALDDSDLITWLFQIQKLAIVDS